MAVGVYLIYVMLGSSRCRVMSSSCSGTAGLGMTFAPDDG